MEIEYKVRVKIGGQWRVKAKTHDYSVAKAEMIRWGSVYETKITTR